MKRRRLKQTTAAIVTSLLSTELTVFSIAQGGKEIDHDSFIPPTLSPSVDSTTALASAIIAPQPAATNGGFRNIDTPLPTFGMSFVATSIGASSPNVMGGGTTFTASPTEEAFVSIQFSDKTCPGFLDRQIVIDPSATLYYHLEPSDPGDSNGILCGRLEVANNNGGWIGFGLSLNGNMIGGEAIVGLTGTGSVLKYTLTSKMSSGVTPMPAARQTLTDTSIRLVGGKTIMTFTKMLKENGEIEIYETGPNAFLHARGSNGQTLGYHDNGRFVFVKDFQDDTQTDPPTWRPTPIPTPRATPRPIVLTPNPTERFIRPTVPVFTPNPTDLATTNFGTGFRPTATGLNLTPNPTEMFSWIPVPVRTPNPTDFATTNFGTGFQPAVPVLTPNPTDVAASISVTGFRPTPTVQVLTPNPTEFATTVSGTGFRDESLISTPSGRDPTMRPVPVGSRPVPVGSKSCNDPSITRDECRASIYCEWVIINGQRNYCQFGPPVPPTLRPSPPPTMRPTFVQTFEPSPRPSFEPTLKPTPWPSFEPTLKPTLRPSLEPTLEPTPRPTGSPTTIITPDPTTRPSQETTFNPTENSSYIPSTSPTQSTSVTPSAQPSSSPTTSSKPSEIPSTSPTLSSEPTLSASHTYYPTKTQFPTLPEYEYKRPQRVDIRWTPWDDLDRNIQIEVSEALGYNKHNWNSLKTNDVEKLRWSDLSERKKAAATMLGFDKWSWNCWVNNFESFSWKQLYEWELTPYLESLGWNSQRWNGQNGPPILKQNRWDDLTNEQRESAMQLCFYKTSYDELNIVEYGFGYPIERPAARFVPWADLDSETRITMEKTHGYNEFTWNVPALNPSELKGWFEMTDSEKRGAEAINCTDLCWDCWQAQYNSYGWKDLVNRGHDESYAALGWSESSWCGESVAPPTSKRSWNELTEQEQLNATKLCLDRFHWDQNSLEVNTGPFPFILPPLRYEQWSSLTFDQQQIAMTVFLYKEKTWDNVGTADIEMRSFDDLTDIQKTYAVELGFYEKTWNCFQNHYRSETWRDLRPGIRSASEVLGWNQSSWGITKPTPDIYDQTWDELSVEEQAAATTLCYFDNTWPGGARDQLVGSVSFLQEGIKSQATRLLPKVAIVASICALMHIFI